MIDKKGQQRWSESAVVTTAQKPVAGSENKDSI